MDELPVMVPRPVPKRVQRPGMVTPGACLSGPAKGEKLPNQLVIEAEYKGKVVKMNIIIGRIVYSLKALKSRVCFRGSLK